MLKTKVKASSLTHLTDARYFAAWETEWLGFQLSNEETSGIAPAQLLAIKEWVDGVKICGELDLSDPAEIIATAEFLQLDTVQVTEAVDSTALSTIASKIPVLQHIGIESYTDPDDIESLLSTNASAVQYFVLNFSQGGITWSDLVAGYPWSEERLVEWATRFPLLIDIDLGEITPTAFLERCHVKGFSVQGGEEEKVGFKSYDELDLFFEDIEEQI